MCSSDLLLQKRPIIPPQQINVSSCQSRFFPKRFEQSAKPVIDFVAGLLDRGVAAGQIAPTGSGLVASAFMSMVISGQVRAIVSGRLPTKAEMDKKIYFTVRLLLDGLRPR